MGADVRAVVPLMVMALFAGCGSPSAPSSTAASIAGTVRMGSTGRPATSGVSASTTTTTLKVTVMGTSAGTMTNSNGEFTLSAPAGNVTLVFEGPGVSAQLPLGRLTAGDRVTITVTVNGSRATLDERHDEDENEGNGSE